MTIRKATVYDLAEAMQIYAEARDYMRKNGNPNQWGDRRPSQEIIEHDIESGNGYVCEEDGRIVAVFYFNTEPDPTYDKIDGAWLNHAPCGVVHRIAKHTQVKGAGAFCINWCFEQCHNIKIDTHKDNIPMKKLLGKLGFAYCGIIWLENGEERLAFQKSEG